MSNVPSLSSIDHPLSGSEESDLEETSLVGESSTTSIHSVNDGRDEETRSFLSTTVRHGRGGGTREDRDQRSKGERTIAGNSVKCLTNERQTSALQQDGTTAHATAAEHANHSPDDRSTQDIVVVAPCQHVFFAERILEYLELGHTACPFCRARITTKDLRHTEATDVPIFPDVDNTGVQKAYGLGAYGLGDNYVELGPELDLGPEEPEEPITCKQTCCYLLCCPCLIVGIAFVAVLMVLFELVN